MPACSFLGDTAAAIHRALGAPPGLYMIDGNERWSLFEIARALGAKHGFTVVETTELERDERMIDPRLEIVSLRVRLPSLVMAN